MRVNIYLPDNYKDKWDLIENKSQLVQEAIDKQSPIPKNSGEAKIDEPTIEPVDE